MIHLTDEMLPLEIDPDKLSVIMFILENCGPCKMMAPIYDQFSITVGSSVKFFTMDFNTCYAKERLIRGTPTFIALLNHKVVTTLLGNRSIPQMIQWLSHYC